MAISRIFGEKSDFRRSLLVLVDHLVADEVNDHAKDRGDGGGQEDVAVVGRGSGVAGEAETGERASAHQPADDGDADRSGDVHHQIVHAHAAAGLILREGAERRVNQRGVDETDARVVDATSESKHVRAGGDEQRGHDETCNLKERGDEDARLLANLVDDPSGAGAEDGRHNERPHDVERDAAGA